MVAELSPSVWGWELCLDCKDCELNKINDLINIEEFVSELCFATGMKKMGELHSHYLEDCEEYRVKDIVGYSVCQFIQTSSITIHFCETSRSMYLNFFSCKDYSDVVVKDLVIKYFKPRTIRQQFLERYCVH